MTETSKSAAPITGFWAAAPTPVGPNGAIDPGALAAHCQRLLGWGCDGIVLFGTSGEGTSFSAAERIAATEAVLEAGIPAARLALGTGCPAVSDTVALTRAMLGLGLVHALILPPYFFRDAPAEGLEDAFAATLDAIADDRLRASLYNIPQVSGVKVPPQTLANLRRRYGQVLSGFKDSSGDFPQFLAYRKAAPDVAGVVGAETDINRANAAGGKGTICGMANLCPDLVQAMFTSAEAETNMRKAVTPITGIPMMKATLAELTREPIWYTMRAPLRPADPAAARAAATTIASLARPLAA